MYLYGTSYVSRLRDALLRYKELKGDVKITYSFEGTFFLTFIHRRYPLNHLFVHPLHTNIAWPFLSHSAVFQGMAGRNVGN